MNPEKQFPSAESQQLSALAIEALQADARRSERRRRNDNVVRPAPARRSVSMRSLFARSGSERKLSPATAAPKHHHPEGSSSTTASRSALDANHHSSNRIYRSRSFRHYRGREESTPPLVAARSDSPPRSGSQESGSAAVDSAYAAARDVFSTVKDCLQEDEWFDDMLRGPGDAGPRRGPSSSDGAPRAKTYSKARQRALERQMTEVRRHLLDDSSALLQEEEVLATPLSATKPALVLEDQESPTGAMQELLNSLESAALNRYQKTAPNKPAARKRH